MQHFTIESACDGLLLSGLYDDPEDAQCKGVIQIVHGMCEHKERYAPFMEFLATNGYTAVIIDHRGHGASVRSEKDLGYMYEAGWHGLVEDQKTLHDWITTKFPGTRHIMLGHSMGSLVARSYAKRYDGTLDTLILTGSPSDNPAKGAGKLLAGAIGNIKGWHSRPALLQKMSVDSYNKPFDGEGYRSAWVCSDKTVLEEYHRDPLCQFVFTADGFYNLLGLMQDVYGRKGWLVSNPALPVHFLSGALDPCRVSDKALEDSAALMRRIGYAHTDVKTYPGMRHEILNETGRLQVWNDITDLL